MCVGDSESKYKKVIDRKGCTCTKNNLIENGLMYSYKSFQTDVIKASTTYTNQIMNQIGISYIKNPLSLSNEKVIEYFVGYRT